VRYRAGSQTGDSNAFSARALYSCIIVFVSSFQCLVPLTPCFPCPS